MRIEVENWLKQAQADLKSAKNCITSKDYYLAVFSCHQASEKALKSVYLSKLKELPKGHSLIYLAQQLGVPGFLLTGIRDLNPEYLSTRYPDMAAGVPSELYDETIAKRHLKTAESIVQWAMTKLL